MANAYHTTNACVTANDGVSAKQSGNAPKAGRHGPTLSVWRAMFARCTNEKHASYASYGGRGITVCDRWSAFENFLADMGQRPDGLSIDRIDNDGNYEPGNCRWATMKEQGRNKRTNVLYEYSGELLCISEIAERAGLNDRVLAGRLNAGWSLQRAVETRVEDVVRSNAEPYTRLQAAMRELAQRRADLIASGLTLDEIANRVPRRAIQARAA